jgi:hypothetical protein
MLITNATRDASDETVRRTTADCGADELPVVRERKKNKSARFRACRQESQRVSIARDEALPNTLRRLRLILHNNSRIGAAAIRKRFSHFARAR